METVAALIVAATPVLDVVKSARFDTLFPLAVKVPLTVCVVVPPKLITLFWLAPPVKVRSLKVLLELRKTVPV